MSKTKISKSNKKRAIQLASQLSNLLDEGVNRIQSNRVFNVFIFFGFGGRMTTDILHLWEDSIMLYRAELNTEKQLKIICHILENIEWSQK